MYVYVEIWPEEFEEPKNIWLYPEDLLDGENIREVLKKRNITEKDFNRATVHVHDKETDLKLSFPFLTYKDFERIVWYLRQRLLKKKKMASNTAFRAFRGRPKGGKSGARPAISTSRTSIRRGSTSFRVVTSSSPVPTATSAGRRQIASRRY